MKKEYENCLKIKRNEMYFHTKIILFRALRIDRDSAAYPPVCAF